MIDPSAEGLAGAAVGILRLDPPPTEEEIDGVLDRLSIAFGADAAIALEAKHLLHARFAIRMDLGETLTNIDEHEPWLDARRGSIDPFYWDRYRKLLLLNGWSPLVATTLDRSTEVAGQIRTALAISGNPA